MKNSNGFSLTEMMIAMLLVSMVGGAMASLMANSFAGQARAMGKNQARLESLIGMNRLSRDVFEAHYIAQPAAAAQGNVLEGYINRIRVNGSWVNGQTGLPDGTYTRFQFCRDAQGRWMYLRDDHAIAVEPPAVECGVGAGWTTIVDNPRRIEGRTEGGMIFSRAGGLRQNLVEAAFEIIDAGRAPAARFEARINLSSQESAEGS